MMQKKLATISIALCCWAAMGSDLGTEDMTIFYARGLHSVATECSNLLKQVFDREFTVKPYSEKLKESKGIFIGIVPREVRLKINPKKETIVRYVTQNQLFLWGRDDNKLKGSNFATYEFLEEVCGVRFLWPGKLGTIVEKSKPVKVPEGLKIYQPPFDIRLTNSFHYGFSYTPRESLNDMLLWLDHARVGSSIKAKGSGFGHAFATLIPREKYGKSNPEYYSLVSPGNWIGEPKPDKPKRTNDPTWATNFQLCTSNPNVRRIIAEKLAANDTDMIQSISPNDGFMFCECDNCKKQDLPIRLGKYGKWPDLTNRMYNFLRDVANQTQKLNRKSRVGLFSYSFFDGVPHDQSQLPDNVFLSLCYIAFDHYDPKVEAATKQQILALGKIGGKIVGREYWGTHYYMELPISHSRKIDENLKLLHKANAAGIYGETGQSFATRATDLYILSRLAWNPTLKREDILHDFCDKAFGMAGKSMYDYFEWVEDQNQNFWLDYYKNPPVNPIKKEYDNSYAERLRAFTQLFDAKFQNTAVAKLNLAKKLAKTPEQKARIQYFIDGIAYVKVMIDSINSFMTLAAAGVNMPLIQPSAKKVGMEKSNLIKIAKAVTNAENARERFILRYLPEFIGLRPFRSNSIDLRPWKSLSEIAVLDLLSNRYNYLVNGAFEYRQYSWEIKTLSGKVNYNFTTSINHDADDNYMSQCHGSQGVSLQFELSPGATVELKQQRQIILNNKSNLAGSLWLRSAIDPLKVLTSVKVNAIDLPTVWVNRELVVDQWDEIRFKPTAAAPGKYTFTIMLKNTASTPQIINLDDLRLLITP